MKAEALNNIRGHFYKKNQHPQCQLPLATERLSHDFSSSRLRTKVGLLQKHSELINMRVQMVVHMAPANGCALTEKQICRHMFLHLSDTKRLRGW